MPVVTITISLGRSRDAFEFRNNRSGVIVRGGLGARLEEAVSKREQLRRNLEAVLKVTDKILELDWERCEAAFRQFSTLGIGFLLYVFNNDNAKLSELERFFLDALPGEPSRGN